MPTVELSSKLLNGDMPRLCRHLLARHEIHANSRDHNTV
jgi:hypothetical protein